jgi:hypothetical protein
MNSKSKKGKVKIFSIPVKNWSGLELNGYWINAFEKIPENATFDTDLVVVGINNLEIENESKELIENRLKLALENGLAICLICFAPFYPSQLGLYILNSFLQGHDIVSKPTMSNKARVKDYAFKTMFDEYGHAGLEFDIPQEQLSYVHIIALNQTGKPCSICFSKGKGMIYVIPSLSLEDGTGLLGSLLKCYNEHKQTFSLLSPILAAYQFSKEKSLFKKLDNLTSETLQTKEEIQHYQYMKSILTLSGSLLVERVEEFLIDHFGLKTKRIEIDGKEENIEDFWLIDGKGNEIALCETKGFNRNVRMEDVSQVLNHKHRRNKSDDFPGILIVNNFNKATSIADKEEPIHADIITQTQMYKVLIIRTLDLVHLLDLAERKVFSTQKLKDILTSETGWMKVGPDGYDIVKK